MKMMTQRIQELILLEFATTGNAQDFGTLSPSNASGGAGVSNGHGGL